jgi:hypothetical protein
MRLDVKVRLDEQLEVYHGKQSLTKPGIEAAVCAVREGQG